MRGRNDNLPQVVELEPVAAATEGEVRNKLIIPIEGQDYQRDLVDLGLSFDSTENEILEIVRPIVLEAFNTDIKNEQTGWLYKVHKALDRQNVYVIPNSVAG